MKIWIMKKIEDMNKEKIEDMKIQNISQNIKTD